MSKRRAAVFLDKDGTLIKDVPYNVDPAKIQLLPGVRNAVQALHQAGFALLVISNQPGIALGYFPARALQDVRQRLQGLLGVPLEGFYFCPHHPQGSVSDYAFDCDCRKPQPGLLLQAAREHQLDLSASWFIGDILNDVEAGRRVGCRTVLLNNGGETQWNLSPRREPHYLVDSFARAADIILARTGSAAGSLIHSTQDA